MAIAPTLFGVLVARRREQVASGDLRSVALLMSNKRVMTAIQTSRELGVLDAARTGFLAQLEPRGMVPVVTYCPPIRSVSPPTPSHLQDCTTAQGLTAVEGGRLSNRGDDSPQGLRPVHERERAFLEALF
jgi:hypothetical protein